MFGYPTLWPGLRKNCIVLYNRGIKKKGVPLGQSGRDV